MIILLTLPTRTTRARALIRSPELASYGKCVELDRPANRRSKLGLARRTLCASVPSFPKRLLIFLRLTFPRIIPRVTPACFALKSWGMQVFGPALVFE